MFLDQDSRYQNVSADTSRTARRLAKKGAAIVGTTLAGISSAFAAVPVGVLTALGDAATDSATIGGLALVAVVAAVSFKYGRRAL